MKTKSFHYLKEEGKTKGENFQPLKVAGVAFDYALPQDWLNDVTKFAQAHQAEFPEVTYDLISSTTVWAYPHDGQNYFNGKPFTCCAEVEAVLTRFYHLSSGGNFEWDNSVKGKA